MGQKEQIDGLELSLKGKRVTRKLGRQRTFCQQGTEIGASLTGDDQCLELEAEFLRT